MILDLLPLILDYLPPLAWCRAGVQVGGVIWLLWRIHQENKS